MLDILTTTNWRIQTSHCPSILYRCGAFLRLHPPLSRWKVSFDLHWRPIPPTYTHEFLHPSRLPHLQQLKVFIAWCLALFSSSNNWEMREHFFNWLLPSRFLSHILPHKVPSHVTDSTAALVRLAKPVDRQPFCDETVVFIRYLKGVH